MRLFYLVIERRSSVCATDAEVISFAFIKATEGSTYVDPNFKTNWEQAAQTELYMGAYHFFSFESPGMSQAEHFSRIVEAYYTEKSNFH